MRPTPVPRAPILARFYRPANRPQTASRLEIKGALPRGRSRPRVTSRPTPSLPASASPKRSESSRERAAGSRESSDAASNERRPDYQRALRNYGSALRDGVRPRTVQRAEGEPLCRSRKQ